MEISTRKVKDFKERKFPDQVCFKPIGQKRQVNLIGLKNKFKCY